MDPIKQVATVSFIVSYVAPGNVDELTGSRVEEGGGGVGGINCEK